MTDPITPEKLRELALIGRAVLEGRLTPRPRVGTVDDAIAGLDRFVASNHRKIAKPTKED